jgi:hypothetical protein
MTDKERRFWEKCGFTHRDPAKYFLEWRYPDGDKHFDPPSINNLEDLLEWAVPVVRETNEIEIIIPPNSKDRFRVRIGHNKPVEKPTLAAALFEALCKDLEVEG